MKKIKINQLYHDYNSNKSLINISCEFHQTKRYLVVGAHQSGKSTLCKLIKGLIKRRRGSIRIDDQLFKPPTQQSLSYLSQNTYLYANITISQFIKYYCDMYSDFNVTKSIFLLQQFNISTKRKITLLTQKEQELILFIFTLCRKADFYLLDNPLKSFSLKKKANIIKFTFNHLDKDNCIIITANSFVHFKSIFDHVLFLSRGYLFLNKDTNSMKVDSSEDLEINDLK